MTELDQCKMGRKGKEDKLVGKCNSELRCLYKEDKQWKGSYKYGGNMKL
jgi:hypothetical protein